MYRLSRQTEHLTEEDQRYYLREAFQSRVTDDSSWTITDSEAHILLSEFAAGILLQAFTVVGEAVRFFKERDYRFFSEDEILDLVKKESRRLTFGPSDKTPTRERIRARFSTYPDTAKEFIR